MTEGISLNRQTLIQPFCLEVSLNAGGGKHLGSTSLQWRDPYPIASSANGLKTVPFVIAGSETTLPTKWKTQTSYEWSMSLQQALWKSGVLEINYVGSSSSHMFTSAQANAVIYGPGATEANLQERRPYPDIGPIELDADLLSANYNALQLATTNSFKKVYGQERIHLVQRTWAGIAQKVLGVRVRAIHTIGTPITVQSREASLRSG